MSGDKHMDEEKNVNEEIDHIYNDAFSEDSDHTNAELKDENEDIFSLLGMSQEEIQKASKDLAKEDEMHSAASATPQLSQKEEQRLESMLQDVKNTEDSKTSNSTITEEKTKAEDRQTKEAATSVSADDDAQEINASAQTADTQPNTSNEMSKAEKKRLKKAEKQKEKEAKKLLKQEQKMSRDDSLSTKQKIGLALFGPEEEEDVPTPEELAKKEQKKQEKEQKKAQKAEESQKKKAEKEEKKAKAKEMAVVKKAAQKDKKEKIRLEEEAEDQKERKIKKSSVITTAIILLALLCTVLFGTNQFNYHMVVKRATNYFEMQKYRLAYEQIVGVKVKDRDQKIKDKVYCVMYVQQQMDAYSNFYKMGMYDNSLDSLIKGLRMYQVHYASAKKLGIEKDLDNLKKQITEALSSKFHLDMATAESWINMNQQEYTKQLQEYVSGLDLTDAAMDSGLSTNN